MVLIPTGLMVAREVWKNVNRKPVQVVRTSSMFTPSQSRELPRRRHQASEATTSKVNPFERKELLARIGGTSVRNLCSKQAEEEKPEPLEKLLKDEKWSIIYRYPDIVKFVLIARFKLMQTVGSVIVIPYMSYLFANTETISPTFYFSTVVAGIVAPLMLIVMSKYLTRIVGVISINETNEYIRVGYMAFWGSRKYLYLDVDDVISLEEVGWFTPRTAKFSWYSGNGQFLYLHTKNVEMPDPERAEIIFGNLEKFTPISEETKEKPGSQKT